MKLYSTVDNKSGRTDKVNQSRRILSGRTEEQQYRKDLVDSLMGIPLISRTWTEADLYTLSTEQLEDLEAHPRAQTNYADSSDPVYREGYEAGLNPDKSWDNPYYGQSFEGKRWNEGWKAGRLVYYEQHPDYVSASACRIRSNRKLVSSDYASSDSFDLGYGAYFADKDPYEENPYEYQSEDWFEWRRGYEKASAQEEFEIDELYSGCHGKSKKKGKKSVKSAFDSEDFFEIYPYDDNADPHSDEDLGLSAVIEVYGDEFVNVDDNTLSGMRDTLERYFDDEAYVRDWNIENSDDQIESIEDVSSVEDLSVDDLAMYFDYEAYGRDIRIGDGYRWDDEKNCWTTNPDVIGQSKKSVKSGIDFDEAEDAADIGYDDFKHGEHNNPFDPDEEPDLYDGWEVGYEKAKKESDF